MENYLQAEDTEAGKLHSFQRPQRELVSSSELAGILGSQSCDEIVYLTLQHCFKSTSLAAE